MRYAMAMLMVGTMGLPLLAGCGDKAVKTEQSHSTNPITGTVTNEDKTTYQRSDGSTYTETQTRKSN